MKWDVAAVRALCGAVDGISQGIDTERRRLACVSVGDQGDATSLIVGLFDTWTKDLGPCSRALDLWQTAVARQTGAVDHTDKNLRI